MRHYKVYGFRLRGGLEVRYVGQTYYEPEFRLVSLRNEGRHAPNPNPVGQWLRQNGDRVEVFLIQQCATRQDALKAERDAIQLLAAVGNRLLNKQHNLALVAQADAA